MSSNYKLVREPSGVGEESGHNRGLHMGPQKLPFPALRYTHVLPGSAALGGAGDAAFPKSSRGGRRGWSRPAECPGSGLLAMFNFPTR